MTIQHKIVACRCRRKSVEKDVRKIRFGELSLPGRFFQPFPLFFQAALSHFHSLCRCGAVRYVTRRAGGFGKSCQNFGHRGLCSFPSRPAFYRRSAPVRRIVEKIRRSEKAGGPADGRGLAVSGVIISFPGSSTCLFTVLMTR